MKLCICSNCGQAFSVPKSSGRIIAGAVVCQCAKAQAYYETPDNTKLKVSRNVVVFGCDDNAIIKALQPISPAKEFTLHRLPVPCSTIDWIDS